MDGLFVFICIGEWFDVQLASAAASFPHPKIKTMMDLCMLDSCVNDLLER